MFFFLYILFKTTQQLHQKTFLCQRYQLDIQVTKFLNLLKTTCLNEIRSLFPNLVYNLYMSGIQKVSIFHQQKKHSMQCNKIFYCILQYIYCIVLHYNCLLSQEYIMICIPLSMNVISFFRVIIILKLVANNKSFHVQKEIKFKLWIIVWIRKTYSEKVAKCDTHTHPLFTNF